MCHPESPSKANQISLSTPFQVQAEDPVLVMSCQNKSTVQIANLCVMPFNCDLQHNTQQTHNKHKTNPCSSMYLQNNVHINCTFDCRKQAFVWDSHGHWTSFRTSIRSSQPPVQIRCNVQLCMCTACAWLPFCFLGERTGPEKSGPRQRQQCLGSSLI